MKVVVIGGGWAGLAAAVHLLERGHQVTVVERRGVLGGRATSSLDAQTHDVVDSGTHLMVGAYHSTLDLVRRVGAEALLDVRSDLRLDYVDERGTTSLACPALPAPLHLAFGLLGLRIGWRARLDALRLGGAISFRRVPPSITLADLFERTAQSTEARELLWRGLATAILNERSDVADARLFAHVFREAFLRTARDSALVFPRCGWGDLAERVGRHVESRDGRIRRRVLVERIVVEGERVTGVACRARPETRAALLAGASSRSMRIGADAVVAAVPWHVLPDLLPEEWGRQAPFAGLPALGSSPIVSIELWLGKKVLDREMLGLRGCDIEWVFDKGRLLGRDGAPQHLSFVVSAAREAMQRTNAELVDTAWQALCRYFPAAADVQIVRSLVLRDPHATYSCTPEAEALRPDSRTPFAGLTLAGDWTATGLPATIEGAVRSGANAALAVSGRP